MSDAKPSTHAALGATSGAASDAAIILIVDDDAAVCWALEQVLVGEGYGVCVAADAAAARRAIRRRAQIWALLDATVCELPSVTGADDGG